MNNNEVKLEEAFGRLYLNDQILDTKINNIRKKFNKKILLLLGMFGLYVFYKENIQGRTQRKNTDIVSELNKGLENN